MLEGAIDLIENAFVQIQADHEALHIILKVAALCLIKGALFDGCHDDLEIAAQLLHVGLALQNLVIDDPAMLRLLLADIHLLQFESSENPEDIDRVATLFGQVPSTYSVQLQHETYLNGLRARMYKTRWEFFRTKKDLATSLSAYGTMFQAISKSSACPSWLTIYFLLELADLLRMHRQKDIICRKATYWRIWHLEKQEKKLQNGN